MSLNKRRIGELYDLPIVTGDQNMVNNHELLLEMNDDNTPKALKQRVNGDQFKTILGEGSGGNTNPGYNVTKQTVTLFNDTVETQDVGEGGMYRGIVENTDFDLVVDETYTIVFDGISYDIKAIASPFEEDIVFLGEISNEEPSFETYPFVITYPVEEGVKNMLLITTTEGSHVVEIKQEEKTVTTTPEFKDAVDSVTGYSIDKENETLYDGTVETEGDGGAFSGMITPAITFIEGDTYKVTFNGTEYICKYSNDYIGASYCPPEFDWSAYPFSIVTYDSGGGQYETVLCTNQEGSYTLKIEHLIVSTKTTPAFESMIQGIAGSEGSEKVVTLENWEDVNDGGESVLTDIEGNKFYEGRDFTIVYNTGVSSNNPFDRIKTINVGGNYQCDKIIIAIEEGAKYIKIPVCIYADSRGNNYAVFGDTETNHIGTLVFG